MAIYRVNIGEREYHIEITESQIRVNGEPVDVNLLPLDESGLYLIRRGDRKRELHLHSQDDSRYEVMADGRHVVAQVEKDRGQPRQTSSGREDGDLVAPMPGIVISVPVEEGDTVERGQVLVVLESMKMQMLFRSPFDGQIAEIAIESSSSVEKGAMMVRVVPEK